MSVLHLLVNISLITSSKYESFSYNISDIQLECTNNIISPSSFFTSFAMYVFVQLTFDPELGWSIPQILPFQSLSFSPAAPVLQYGLGCFEGMKAFAGHDGALRLFRPSLNMARFNKSASRLLLPNFNEHDLLRCIEGLIRVDERWVPRGHGQSLYIRPTLVATSSRLGVFPSTTSKLFVLTSPCGHYFRSGFKAIQLYANENLVRAWPGGAGDCKVGGMYIHDQFFPLRSIVGVH